MRKATAKQRGHHLRRARLQAKRVFRHRKRRIIRRDPARVAAQRSRLQLDRKRRRREAEARRQRQLRDSAHAHAHGKDNPVPVRGEPSGQRGLMALMAGAGVWGSLIGKGR